MEGMNESGREGVWEGMRNFGREFEGLWGESMRNKFGGECSQVRGSQSPGESLGVSDGVWVRFWEVGNMGLSGSRKELELLLISGSL